MTAPQSGVCGERFGRTGVCDMPKGHPPVAEAMGWLHSEDVTPAAPSELPAADSLTPGIEVAGERTIYPCRCWGDSFGVHLHKHDRHFVAPSDAR